MTMSHLVLTTTTTTSLSSRDYVPRSAAGDEQMRMDEEDAFGLLSFNSELARGLLCPQRRKATRFVKKRWRQLRRFPFCGEGAHSLARVVRPYFTGRWELRLPYSVFFIGERKAFHLVRMLWTSDQPMNIFFGCSRRRKTTIYELVECEGD